MKTPLMEISLYEETEQKNKYIQGEEMKNQWMRFFFGIVNVKLSGKGLERILNSLIRSGFSIWRVKRQGTDAITFKITLADAKKLRHALRNTGCRMEFLQRTGYPFLIKRLKKNSGFLFGGLIFFAIIFLLSNMIWSIDIKGANPATEYKIRKELEELGVKKGRFQFLVKDPESIQRSLSNSIEEITWVGVEMQGTTYHLQVVVKNEPEKPEKTGPQNLVAKKKAVIMEMFVEEGQPIVEIYEHVKPGQLLVSGEIGNENEKRSVSAKGKVIGETWYKSKVVLPLKSNFLVYNGNEKQKLTIKIGNMAVQFWGTGKLPFKQYEKETNEKNFQFMKWELPISYVQDNYRESEQTVRSYTKEEGLNVAKEMAREDIRSQLPEDATIREEKALQHSFRNGKVYLTMLFQVFEDIAEAQPIIQGESE